MEGKNCRCYPQFPSPQRRVDARQATGISRVENCVSGEINERTAMHIASSTGKIALFLPSLGGGGAERIMLNLAAGLSARGIDVDLSARHRDWGIPGPHPGGRSLGRPWRNTTADGRTRPSALPARPTPPGAVGHDTQRQPGRLVGTPASRRQYATGNTRIQHAQR